MARVNPKEKASAPKIGSFYLRSVISNLILILIPIILITVLYASRYTEKYKKEVYETISMALGHLASQSEFQFSNLGNIAMQTSVNGSLKEAMDPKTMLGYKATMTTMSLIATANPFVSEIILIPTSGDYAVTTNSTIQKSFLYRRGLAVEGYDPDDLRMALESRKAYAFPFSEVTVFSNSYYNGRSLILTYPVTMSGKARGTLSFIITEDTMRKMIEGKLLTHNSDILIIDNMTQRLLFSTRKAQDPMEPSLFAAHPRKVEGDDGKTYLATYADSAGGRRTYVSLISEDHPFEQIESLRTEFILSLMVVIALCLLIGYALHRLNYRSIQGLDDKARKIIPAGGSTDIENVANALDMLSTKNTELTNQITRNRSAVVDHRLDQLLSGCYGSPEEFNRSCRDLGLSMKHESSAVAVFVFDGDWGLEEMAGRIRPHIIWPSSFFLMRKIARQIILIINAEEDQEERIAESLQECLEDFARDKKRAAIALSSFHRGTKELPNAYVETLNALDYSFIKGYGSIIRKSDIPDMESMEREYPKKEIDQLELSIRRKDIHRIRESAAALFDLMRSRTLPVFMCRSISFDMANVLKKQQIEKTDALIDLERKNTLSEIEAAVAGWLDGLKGREKEQMDEKFIRNIFDYIDRNVYGCGFSVSSCADHFGMNLPALSKYFKEKTGKTILNYVIDKRSGKARQLLKDTGKPFKSIAAEVGYTNITSFNRRFKLSTGMTPGEYRKAAREEALGGRSEG